MNECTYIGRICTDLVLNKKAMDDNERQWTRFRLAVPEKGLKRREKKIQIFLTVLLLVCCKGNLYLCKKGGRICVCGENREKF